MSESVRSQPEILLVREPGVPGLFDEGTLAEVTPVTLVGGEADGIELLRTHPDRFGSVIYEQYSANGTWREFFTNLRKKFPDPCRILVSGEVTVDDALEALNEGTLYYFLTPDDARKSIVQRVRKALNHFDDFRLRKGALEEKAASVQQFIMAERAASVGILSMGLNHHLRNALTVVRTFFDLIPVQLTQDLGESPIDEDFWIGYRKDAEKQLRRIHEILSRLSESTDPGALQIGENVDLPVLLEKAARKSLKHEPGLRFVQEIQGDLPTIAGDEKKLKHMARLLFAESVISTRGKGKIKVTLEPIESAYTGREAVHLRFEDDGDPLVDGDPNRIFDPFFVRRECPDEIGNNLLACYLTVYFHGGSIHAERTDDGKNVVVIVLPTMPLCSNVRDFRKAGSGDWAEAFPEDEVALPG